MNKRAIAIRAFSVALALSFAPIALATEPVDTVQDIITGQISAFLNEDAEAAYFFASPAIRKKFPDRNIFFEMVKRGYQPVYRPDNFKFGRSKIEDGMIFQEVLIVGPDGEDWTALYQMQKQPDGSYKINGVRMLKQKPGPEI